MSISPEIFYSFVLEPNPSRAIETLETIPLVSRVPFVTFQNQEGEEKLLPLHAAARAGHASLVQLLIYSGSDKDAKMNDGRTSIFLACQEGHHQVVELLLSSGADKNAPTDDQLTPMYIASQNGRYEVVKLLLAAGVNINAPAKDGVTALWVASWKGHDLIVERLLAAGADLSASKDNGETPLWIAACFGHHKVMSQLLAAGADTNTPRDNGQSPLWIAACKGCRQVIELLLAAGADKNAAMNDGITPTWIASQKGYHQVVELLLAADADINAADTDGRTPLYAASREGHHRVVELLLAAGADKNAAKKDGWTPIMVASRNGHLKVVEPLLVAGADHSHRTQFGTASGIAKQYSQSAVFGLLSSQLLQATVTSCNDRQQELKSQLSRMKYQYISSEMPSSSIQSPPPFGSFHARQQELKEHLAALAEAQRLRKEVDQLRAEASQFQEKLRNAKQKLKHMKSKEHARMQVTSVPQILKRSDIFYDKKQKLGEGGFGAVYRGQHDNMPVAVKLMIADPHREATDLAVNFLKEVIVMTSIQSPYLVRLVGICAIPQIMVMELMEGGSLYARLHSKPLSILSWETKWNIIFQIALGIQFLHTNGVAHRDLKTQNILLSGDLKQVKLADFGLSRTVGIEGHAKTINFGGTPFYLAPEMLTSAGINGGLTCDIYALGIIMWEVGFQKIPYCDSSPNDFDYPLLIKFYTLVRDHNFRPSIDHQVGLSPDFIRLFERCWSAIVEDRPKIDQILTELPLSKDQASQALPFSSTFNSAPTAAPHHNLYLQPSDQFVLAAPSHVPAPSQDIQELDRYYQEAEIFEFI